MDKNWTKKQQKDGKRTKDYKDQDDDDIKKKDEKKLDWMYKAPTVNREDYLLGRKVDKQFEQMVQAEKESDPNKTYPVKNHVEHECIPPSLRNFSGDQQVDMVRKLQEDPLFMIKKKEMETKAQLLKNPVKLKKLQNMIVQQQNQSIQSKDQQKKKKKSSNDSDEELDRLLIEKFKQLKGEVSFKDLINALKKSKKRKKSKKKSKNDTSESDDDDKKSKKYKKSNKEYSRKKNKDSKKRNKKKYSISESSSSSSTTSSSSDSSSDSSTSSSSDSSEDERESRKSRKQRKRDRSESVEKSKKYKKRERSRSIENSKSRKHRRRDRSESFENKKKYKRDQSESVDRKKNKKLKKSSRKDSSDSDDGRRNKSRQQSYGLMRADGSKISPSRKRESSSKENYKRKEIENKEPVRIPPIKRPKLSDKEKEKKRQEMMANAAWRDKERALNVKRYEEEEKREAIGKDSSFDKNFLQKQLAMAANKESVASRIKSNINNIQRHHHSMDKNFAKR